MTTTVAREPTCPRVSIITVVRNAKDLRKPTIGAVGLRFRRSVGIRSSAIGLGAFLLLAKSVQNSPEFGRLQIYILAFDICGVIALTVLLARRLWRPVRDYRAHVPGSRLTARTVAIFGALVIAPLLIVYLSSLEFINQGIDSWFKVEVKQGPSDAVVLSRAALDLRTREYAARTVALAHSVTHATPGEVQARLDADRRASQALEVILFAADACIVAARLENPLENLPAQPPADLVRQVGQHLPYVSLEPQSGGRYLIRTAAALGGPDSRDERFVVASTRCPRSSRRCRRPCRTHTRSTVISRRSVSPSSTASA
jgi:hypothetical protein